MHRFLLSHRLSLRRCTNVSALLLFSVCLCASSLCFSVLHLFPVRLRVSMLSRCPHRRTTLALCRVQSEAPLVRGRKNRRRIFSTGTTATTRASTARSAFKVPGAQHMCVSVCLSVCLCARVCVCACVCVCVYVCVHACTTPLKRAHNGLLASCQAFYAREFFDLRRLWIEGPDGACNADDGANQAHCERAFAESLSRYSSMNATSSSFPLHTITHTINHTHTQSIALLLSLACVWQMRQVDGAGRQVGLRLLQNV